MGNRVIILGGGVGGMSAAHELAERDFDVTVYETRPIAGGKARSVSVPGSGTGGRRDLPGEHGFRFFPGFYRHLPDTMRRIPIEGRRDGVFGNLVSASEVQIARDGGSEIVSPAHFPASLRDLDLAFRTLFTYATDVGIPVEEQFHFADRLLLLLTGCEERRFAEYENQSWWSFSGAESRSPHYRKFLADGLTRSLVAAKAREMSAPHRRLHPASAPLRSLTSGRRRGPRTERPHQRRLDRSLARASAWAGCRLSNRAPGAGDSLRSRPDHGRHGGHPWDDS